MQETKVEKLPEDIGQLQNLQVFQLAGCKHLKTLPESFGCLEQLEHLDMSRNPSLQMLPKNFGRLKALNYLNLGGCSFGEGIGLPSIVGDFTNLKSLSLDGNFMSTIPKSFEALNALQWQDSPMLELPRNLNLFNLVELNLFNLVELNLGHSKILKCLWECDRHTQV
jgi:Leucine-rich repeat (LRR) protein